MKVFANPLTKTERFNSVIGDREKIKYQGRLDEDGTLRLIEVGKENLYEQIQSHKDSCDIYSILRRYESGDLDVLSRVQGVYADVTELPKNYAELLNSVIKGREAFDSLPIEVKEKFGQDFNRFAATIGTQEWYEKLGYKQDISDEVSGVVKDQQEVVVKDQKEVVSE